MLSIRLSTENSSLLKFSFLSSNNGRYSLIIGTEKPSKNKLTKPSATSRFVLTSLKRYFLLHSLSRGVLGKLPLFTRSFKSLSSIVLIKVTSLSKNSSEMEISARTADNPSCLLSMKSTITCFLSSGDLLASNSRFISNRRLAIELM
ncbi:hypothetical protein ES703_119108 [subsurface metagenome]